MLGIYACGLFEKQFRACSSVGFCAVSNVYYRLRREALLVAMTRNRVISENHELEKIGIVGEEKKKVNCRCQKEEDAVHASIKGNEIVLSRTSTLGPETAARVTVIKGKKIKSVIPKHR